MRALGAVLMVIGEFSREGARVFVVGRTPENLEAVANDIKADGGAAEVAVLDALDEQAALTPADRSCGHGGDPGLREGRRYHRHVRQRHQRDVPQLDWLIGKDW